MPEQSLRIRAPITAEILIASGYQSYLPARGTDPAQTRDFVRAFDDTQGRRYILTFHEWNPDADGRATYEAKLTIKTLTDGQVLATLNERTLEAAESRAFNLWQACGGCYRDT